MTLKNFANILSTTGIPVYYQKPLKAKNPPIICYSSPYSNNFSADGKVYAQVKHLQVELYTKQKDEIAESKVETALSSFFWQKTEIYIESENIYQIVYELEV